VDRRRSRGAVSEKWIRRKKILDESCLNHSLTPLSLGKASRTVKIISVLITLREPGNVKLRFVVAATTMFVIQKSALSES